jgi:uncharacterized protein YqhQ
LLKLLFFLPSSPNAEEPEKAEDRREKYECKDRMLTIPVMRIVFLLIQLCVGSVSFAFSALRNGDEKERDFKQRPAETEFWPIH